MRIELRDERRRRSGRASVTPADRPTRVAVQASMPSLHSLWKRIAPGNRATVENGSGASSEVFLTWDSALDDGGHLRKCVVCGCGDLFREKAFPQVTGFVVVLAFAGAVIGALGLATRPPVLTAMAVVLVLDVAILVFSRRRLVCYRCRASYHDLPIARYHRSWDRALADRHAAKDQRTTADAQSNSQPQDLGRSRSALATHGP